MDGPNLPTTRIARGSMLGVAAAGQVLRAQRARIGMVGRSNEVRARMSAESTMRAAEQIVAVLGSMKGIAEAPYEEVVREVGEKKAALVRAGEETRD